MKKYFILLGCSIFGAALAQSQTQPAPGAPSAAQPAVPSQSRGAQTPGTPRQINPAQPGTERDTIFNQPAGANRPEPVLPNSTNAILPNTTNPIIANPTSPFIVDPSGAVNPQTQTGQTGTLTNQSPNASEQAFTQRLRAAVGQAGSQQIFSPQSQSMITVINQNGTITLQGLVKNEGQKRSIEARIQSMEGVRSINNQLRVDDAQQTLPQPTTPGSENERRLFNP